MGIDLVGELSDFSIKTEDFRKIEERGDGSVEYGCIVMGRHRVLRFNMDTLNKGDKRYVLPFRRTVLARNPELIPNP